MDRARERERTHEGVAQRHPHLGKGHGDEERRRERDEEDLEHFLVLLGEDGEDGGRVLGRVVVHVDKPERVDLVRSAAGSERQCADLEAVFAAKSRERALTGGSSRRSNRA